MVNPYFPVINKANEQMVKALIEIGMSPSSRSRVKVSEPEKEVGKKERFLSERIETFRPCHCLRPRRRLRGHPPLDR